MAATSQYGNFMLCMSDATACIVIFTAFNIIYIYTIRYKKYINYCQHIFRSHKKHMRAISLNSAIVIGGYQSCIFVSSMIYSVLFEKINGAFHAAFLPCGHCPSQVEQHARLPFGERCKQKILRRLQRSCRRECELQDERPFVLPVN